jgi:hypothetical protein
MYEGKPMQEPKVFRTTVRLNALSRDQLLAIQRLTRLNATQVLGNALAIYAERIAREDKAQKAASARRE